MKEELETMGIVNNVSEFCCKYKQRNGVASDKGSEIVLLPFFDEKLCGNENTAIDREN